MSGEYTVDVQGWFSCAWNSMMARPNVVMRGLAVMLLFALVSLGLGMLPGGIYIGYIVQFTIGSVLQAGWYLFCLRLVRDEEVSTGVIFEPFSRFWQVWLTAIAVPLVTAVGLLLFVIPGLYFWARFGMAVFAAVDKRLDVNDALEFSSRITEGSRLQVLLLHLLLAAIGLMLVLPSLLEMNNLGLLTMLGYVFILTPLSGTAYASAYDSLVATRAGEAKDTDEEDDG